MMQTMQSRHSITEQLIAKTRMMSQEQQRCLLNILNGESSDLTQNLSGSFDQRIQARKRYFIPVDYVVKDRCFRDFIRDINAKSVFIETNQRFSVGESISLSFMLRPDAYPIKIGGRIVNATSEGIMIKFFKENALQIEALSEVLGEL